MDGILSRSAGPTHIPRILMAENHFSTMESLIQTLGDRRFHLDFDVCTSHHSAVRKLLASPYQLIISGVHLAAFCISRLRPPTWRVERRAA